MVGRHGEAWKVRVSAAPERGKANAALVSLLSGALGVPERDVEIVGGHASRDKVVALRGLSSEQVESRLAQAAGGDA